MATPTSAAGPHPRRPRLLVVATVASAVLLGTTLAGCANGFHAQTDEIYQPGPGISVRQDGVYLLNAAIITDGSGNGTLIGALLDQKRAPDQLLRATITGKGAPAVTIVPGTIRLPPHQSVQLADSGDVRVAGTMTLGTYLTVTLTFHNGEPITVQLPVLSQSLDFKDVPVGPVPTPVTPSATAATTP